jgi:hypothetical protein
MILNELTVALAVGLIAVMAVRNWLSILVAAVMS